MPESPNYDVFVSYVEADRAWVEGYLLAALEQAGVRCMYESAFALGVPRLLEFERSIKQSKRTLLVISPNYLADGLNEFIATLGQSYGQDTNTWPVIPLIRQSVPLPPRLGMLVGLKATNEKEQESAIAQLCADLKRPLPTPPPPPDCPYPGMKPFGLGDRDRFFGREEEVNQLLEHLRLHPFITVIGPSGSGKSSLVFAGLIPALQASSLFGMGGWQVQSMRPGVTPQTTLKQTLASGAQQQAARMLLLVDQFEELFTLAKEEAVPFQEGLLELVKSPNVYLLLTVRADFYADLMTSLLWQEIQNYRLEVVPLNEAGLRQAILKPAEAVGVFVEPALVERLVTDAAGEPGVLPLIQETLVLLWQRLERRFLPLRAYEALVLPRTAYGGQETGQKTGLQVAIAQRADQAIKDLKDESEKQQAIARRIFLRLIQFGEGRADTRRQQPFDALRAAKDDLVLFKRTFKHLVDCRLLTLSGDVNNSTRRVDIAHEALITGWPTLQQWITERRGKEEVRRRLTIKAEEWARFGCEVGGLLDLVALSEAEDWLSSPDASDLGYEESLVDLIRVSRKAIEEAERQAAEQQERELRHERKARRAAQALTRFIIVFSIVLLGLATFSGYKWREADIGQIQALSQSSVAEFTLNRYSLNSLTNALEAGRLLERSPWILNSNPKLRASVMTALTQAVFWTKEQNRLKGHSKWVTSLSFSPDSQTIASSSGDKTIVIWNRDGSKLGILQGHTDSVNSVSFSPVDGQTLVSGGRDKTVRLWRQDGTLLRTFNTPGSVMSVGFSPDGQIIAASGNDNKVRLWQLDGKPLAVLSGHQGRIDSINFSPNGQTIASASHDSTVKLWRRDGSLITTLEGHQSEVFSVSFSPDGQIIASTGRDDTVKLWQSNGTPITTFKVNSNGVNAIRFSPDGRTLASAGQDNTVKLWTRDGALLTVLHGHTNWVTSVAFSADGQILGSTSNDGSIKLWQLQNSLLTVLPNDNYQVNSISFSPDGELLAAASMDNTIKLWRRDGSLMSVLSGHQDRINSVRFSPNGEIFASVGEDGQINFWKRDGRLVLRLESRSKFLGLSFSPDGEKIVTSNQSGEIQLWQEDGNLLNTVQAHRGFAYSVEFSADGSMFASAGSDGSVKLWKLDGTPLITLNESAEEDNVIYNVIFSPANQMVGTASTDGTIKLWKIDGTMVTTLMGKGYPMNTVTFSPDEKIIAAADEVGTIFLWQLDGTLITELNGHSKGVLGLSFSLDGKTLASAGDDTTIILWNLENLELKRLLGLGCSKLYNFFMTNPSIDKSHQKICINS